MASTLRFDNWENSNGDLVASSQNFLRNNRNLVYNGAMQVSQRGTSTASITTSGYYTADRWNTSLNGLGTWTQSVENDGPTGSGFTKSLKMLCTTADGSPSASDNLNVLQRLEGQDVQSLKFGTSDAESLTITFWVKSNVTGTYVVRLRNIDAGKHIAQTYTVSSSDTWEKKTLTFAGDTSGSFTNDNSSALQVDFWLGAGSDYTSGSLPTSWASQVTADIAVGQTNLAATVGNYWQITGVQLEAGTVATPFEHKSYGTELAECQRYYQVYDTGEYGLLMSRSTIAGTGTPYGGFRLVPEMRATPTGIIEASEIGSVQPTSIQMWYSTKSGVSLQDTTSRSANSVINVRAKISLSAEL